MKFLVTWKSFETIAQEQAKATRAGSGQEIEQMFDSPKIKDVGGFADARGLYMILDDVNSADEITEILGPEILDNGYVESRCGWWSSTRGPREVRQHRRPVASPAQSRHVGVDWCRAQHRKEWSL